MGFEVMRNVSMAHATCRAKLAIGFALAVSVAGCGFAVEQPPRAMYGTASWSQGWDDVCIRTNLDEKEPETFADYRARPSCSQYAAAQEMRLHTPTVAQSVPGSNGLARNQ